jgi:hypothetical protein
LRAQLEEDVKGADKALLEIQRAENKANILAQKAAKAHKELMARAGALLLPLSYSLIPSGTAMPVELSNCHASVYRTTRKQARQLLQATATVVMSRPAFCMGSKY